MQALVLADHVYRDRDTGKCIIAGTFNQIFGPKFPARFNMSTYAYVFLTNLHGSSEIILRYCDLQNNEVLMETKPLAIQSDDPIRGIEMIIQIPPFQMPHEGAFTFEVHASGELLGSVRILASLQKKDEQNE